MEVLIGFLGAAVGGFLGWAIVELIYYWINRNP